MNFSVKQANFQTMLSDDNFQHEIYVYKLILHINGISSLLSSTLATFMILKKSTPQMAQYKFYLLNIVVWSALLDIYIGVFYVPFPTFPGTGVCTEGLFNVFDNPTFNQLQFVSHSIIFKV
jgi:hypothetical protein